MVTYNATNPGLIGVTVGGDTPYGDAYGQTYQAPVPAKSPIDDAYETTVRTITHLRIGLMERDKEISNLRERLFKLQEICNEPQVETAQRY
jgi:hypothetical protein